MKKKDENDDDIYEDADSVYGVMSVMKKRNSIEKIVVEEIDTQRRYIVI